MNALILLTLINTIQSKLSQTSLVRCIAQIRWAHIANCMDLVRVAIQLKDLNLE